MQRVRIGLTGLAAVLVLVLLAAAVFGLRSDDPPPVSNHAATPVAAGRSDAEKEPREPLAELGVTPGGAGRESATRPGDIARPR